MRVSLRASAHISGSAARASHDPKYGSRRGFVPRNLATDVPYAARMSSTAFPETAACHRARVDSPHTLINNRWT